MDMETHGAARAKRGSKAAEKVTEMAKLLRRYFVEKYEGRKVRENIAADYGICPRQAGTWLSTGPTTKHLCRIIAREGMAFVHAVIHPIATAREIHERRLDARQHALEQQLAAEQADLAADVAGDRPGRRRGASRLFSILGPLKARRRQMEAM